MHDRLLPREWHTVKSVLLTEMATAGTFHLCSKVADALFHARLLAESCAREGERLGCGISEQGPRPGAGEGER